jgi:hypothetical protein
MASYTPRNGELNRGNRNGAQHCSQLRAKGLLAVARKATRNGELNGVARSCEWERSQLRAMTEQGSVAALQHISVIQFSLPRPQIHYKSTSKRFL